MLPCKNDKTKMYTGDEPSPKGLGWCSNKEKEGKIRKGRDGNMWIVRKLENGTHRWVKYNEEAMIVVSYGSTTNDVFPNYRMQNFPRTWKYDGHEGALTSQPMWQTNNAYFYGPKKDSELAKKSIKTLYDKYKQNGFITRFSMKMSKV